MKKLNENQKGNSQIKRHLIPQIHFSKKQIVIQIHLALEIILLIISTFFLLKNRYLENWYFVISILAIMMLILQAFGYFIYEISIINFVFVFLLLSYLFMFGIVFLLALGMEEAIFWDLHTEFSNNLLLKSGLIILNYLQMFYIGSLLGIRKNYSKFYGKYNYKNYKLTCCAS